MIVGIIGYYFVESPNFAANKKKAKEYGMTT